MYPSVKCNRVIEDDLTLSVGDRKLTFATGVCDWKETVRKSILLPFWVVILFRLYFEGLLT